MRRRIFNVVAAVSLLICLITVGAFAVSFVKPVGMSKNWVYLFRNSSDAYRNGFYRGAPGQGTRLIILTNGVLYDHSYAYGNPYVDRSKLVLREYKWHPDTTGTLTLAKATLGFSWGEMYWQSAGYSHERQVSIPLLFIALITGMLPAVRFMSPRRRFGCCAKCGYDLTGNTSGICPECGSEVGGTEKATEPGKRLLGREI